MMIIIIIMIVITIIIIIVGRRRRRTWSSVCVMDWGGWREGRGGEKGVQREWTSSDREQAQTRGRTRDTLNSCFPVFFIILFLLILFILRFSFAEKCDWAFFFVSLNFHRLRLSIIFISLDYKADDVMFSSIFLWFLYSCFFFLSFSAGTYKSDSEERESGNGDGMSCFLCLFFFSCHYLEMRLFIFVSYAPSRGQITT